MAGLSVLRSGLPSLVSTMQTQKLVGRRIRSLRTDRGLTQQELGERAELSYKYLGAVERGEENPSLLVLERIAAGLEVELFDIFNFAHEETNPRTLRNALNRLLAGADPAQLQMACKFLRALLR